MYVCMYVMGNIKCSVTTVVAAQLCIFFGVHASPISASRSKQLERRLPDINTVQQNAQMQRTTERSRQTQL